MENSELKPVTLRLKTDLMSHTARAEELGKVESMDHTNLFKN